MNSVQFSKAYKQSATGRYHPDQEKVAMFQSAHKWSDRFSELTHDILQNKAPAPETSMTLLQSYLLWAHDDLSRMVQEAWNIANENDQHNLTKLNFHMLNFGSIALWKHVLVDRRTTTTPTLVRSVQNSLAAHAVDFMRIREQGIEDGNFFSSEHKSQRSVFLGLLNEFDTAITAQEISLRSPSIVVLPAASQFESSIHSERNSDLLAIDLKVDSVSNERRARGIQAKLFTDQETYDKIDKDYVTVVDGIVDLGSTKKVRPFAHRSYEEIRQWPGLIAAHHLISVKNMSIAPDAAKATMRKSHDKAAMVQAMNLTTAALHRKHEAKEHAAGTKSNNKKAANIVVKRVLAEI